MEEEPTDPHEKQLFQEFKSCLAKGQSKLNTDGLLDLCGKLELDQSHSKTILELLKVEATQKLVSFYEFRDAFVTLLDKSQETPVNGLEKEVNGESDIFSKNGTMCTKYNHQSEERKKQEAVNSQQTDKIVSHQRLQETWTNQNSLTEDVNSFFNRDLALSKQAIQVIFEKLDRDCDGLINLSEFLNFFESSNKLLEQFNVSWSNHLQRDHAKSDNCKDFDHHQNGPIPRSAIVELWEVAGVSDANSLLIELGFNSPTINLIDLSNALSSELKLHRDVSHAGGAGEYVRLLKGALILYQEEVRNLNSSMEHLRGERDKLRSDIGEANERANLFAQELDEQQSRMDKFREDQLRQLELRHAETIKSLDNQQQFEREKSTGALKSMEEQLQASQQEELRLKTELASVLRDLKELESDNQGQNETIRKLEANNGQLSLQVQELAAAREQVESIETKENEQVAELSDHIRRLQTEIKVLRDHNDELTSELEMLKHRDNDAKSVVSSVDVRSTISDENDGLISMTSDTEDEEKHTKGSKQTNGAIMTMARSKPLSDDVGISLNKLSEIIQEFRNFLTGAKFCAECATLRTEVSSLISELELYQSSVPPSPASIKTKSTAVQTASTSNKRRKHLKTLAIELEAESNGCKLESLGAIPKSGKLKHSKKISSSDDAIDDLEKSLGNLDLDERESLSVSCDTENNNSVTEVVDNLDCVLKQNSDEQSLTMNKELEQLLAEKQQLLEKCNELESNLEMLRNEYFECEDYWSNKLDEERQIFEQEQKINDDKLADLMVKIAEYEEQYSPENKRDGRLSPVEEQAMLEQQYMALEEEYERWKLDAQEELNSKEEEIDELKAKLARGERRRQSLKDSAVQFPEEQMKDIYPVLYSTICSSTGGSADNSGVDKVDATLPDKTEPLSQCLQCHKSTPDECDCHASSQQQTQQSQQQQQQQPQKQQQQQQKNQQQQPKDQRPRRSDGKSRHHHHHHHPKRNIPDMDYELMNLVKQKEKLKQEIMRLQSYKTMSMNHMYSFISPAEQNVVSNLYAKLYAQEQKQKYLQFCLTNQQKENERIMQGMWKQHIIETQDLRLAIKNIEDKLKYQIRINKDQNEKLSRGDILTKELYVENAKLTETIKRLEQHCQILTQNRIESTT